MPGMILGRELEGAVPPSTFVERSLVQNDVTR